MGRDSFRIELEGRRLRVSRHGPVIIEFIFQVRIFGIRGTRVLTHIVARYSLQKDLDLSIGRVFFARRETRDASATSHRPHWKNRRMRIITLALHKIKKKYRKLKKIQSRRSPYCGYSQVGFDRNRALWYVGGLCRSATKSSAKTSKRFALQSGWYF